MYENTQLLIAKIITLLSFSYQYLSYNSSKLNTNLTHHMFVPLVVEWWKSLKERGRSWVDQSVNRT